jgi:hypothetical protein
MRAMTRIPPAIATKTRRTTTTKDYKNISLKYLGSETCKGKIYCFFRALIWGQKMEISEGFSQNLQKSVMFWNRNQCIENTFFGAEVKV